ncbi:MAG: pyridoxamine 5'-phosphate oxidase family protein, partial [Rhodospirillales bacterium]
MISSDIAFTRSVKSIQQQKGSRAAYRRMEEAGGWQTEVTADLAAFLAEQRTAYLATVNADGQPYIQ